MSGADQGPRRMSRRAFGRTTAAAGAAGIATGCMAAPASREAAPLGILAPPADAKRVPTGCDYCAIGCSYEAIVWPVEAPEGEPRADAWYAPSMHTIAPVDGRPHHVVVRPDPRSEVVNRGGDYSVRGGTLAQKLWAPDRETDARLKRPQLRLDGELVDIEWDDALDIVAAVSRHVIDTHGEAAWGMKQYSYQFYENTYALSKLALSAVATPAWAVHDKPAAAPDVPGLDDAGVYAFNASFADWKAADAIYVSGVSLYDAKSILFQDWIVPGGAKLVVANPRRDLTAAYAESKGGLHLQLVPGTDVVLMNAIAREIVDQGWEDSAFIEARIAREDDIALEGGFRVARFGRDFEAYRDFLRSRPEHTPEVAAQITQVPAEKIRLAARMLAAPTERGERRKSSFMLEKGNYWGHNIDNTNAFVSMALLTGAGTGPGRVIGRAGGHQRGMIKGGRYPLHKSPDRFEDQPLPLNVDRWFTEGRLRFMWVVGTTWCSAMGASGHLAEVARILTRETGPQLGRAALMPGGRLDVSAVIAALIAKADALGTVLVQQEIYPNDLTALADLVLPAATWGEADFTRMQAERRLRIYSRISDAPGEARPDWRIVAGVAQRMGYDGFDWPDENAVFEEAAAASAGSAHDYVALVELARRRGVRGHELLRELDTTGIQCPIRAEGDALVGTERLHDERFHTESGRAIFMEGSWDRVHPTQVQLQPTGDELWVTNVRVNAVWQSMADDQRIPQRLRSCPANFLEIHPDDASARGIRTGDRVEIQNDAVLNQQGQPHLARVEAVAMVTDAVLRGVTATYFNHRGRLRESANCLTSGQVDPMNPIYRYKLGKGRVVRLGRSEIAHLMPRVMPNRI